MPKSGPTASRARGRRERDAACAIAQAAAVMGDWWSLLIVREVARGRHRFDVLLRELGISRKVLTERLAHLVAHDVLRRVPYQDRPVRHEYRLTDAGLALTSVLISMQDWADRWVLGDGSLTGVAPDDGATAHRVHALLGATIPELTLPSTPRPQDAGTDRDAGTDQDAGMDVVDGEARATVIFAYPATGIPAPLPPEWGEIPGAAGCTLENRLFRDAAGEFAAVRVALRGVSTQRPDEQAAFATAERIGHPLLSDAELRLAAALRLPTFRAGQVVRLKRLILIADPDRVVRHVIFPVLDVPEAVGESLRVATALASGNS
ncbi:MAG: winged helix-turn-helix transcriptional regulator [Micromonosporaceae bacterium]